MPLTAEELEKLPPTIRREFDLTQSTYVDLVGFFVEHPENAYSPSEIMDIADANPDVYSALTSDQWECPMVDKVYFKTLCRLELVESVSNEQYFLLADEEAARAILEVANWVEDNDAISELQRRRALREDLD